VTQRKEAHAVTIPRELSDAIATARAALLRDPRGHLERGRREAVWAALGPKDDEGRARRTRVAEKSARRVLGIWKQHWPRDHVPERMLALADEVLGGSADRRSALRERDAAFTAMDSLSASTPAKAAVMSGLSAVQALTAAIRDEVFDPARTGVATKDEDVDPEDHDASYLAALAFAGGPPWDPNADPDARRAFWEWWLGEAVPEAREAQR
jgi:hypothetical protein